MFDGRVNVRLMAFEHAGDDLLSGECGKRERTYEFLGGASHDDLHLKAAVLKKTKDLSSLVGRDPAGDTEGDFHRSRWSPVDGQAATGRRNLDVKDAPCTRNGASPELFALHRLVEEFVGFLRGALRLFGYDPLNLAVKDLIAGDAAGFAGLCFDHRTCTALDLAGASGGNENEPVVAVEP